jgi:hypothetical protein
VRNIPGAEFWNAFESDEGKFEERDEGTMKQWWR